MGDFLRLVIAWSAWGRPGAGAVGGAGRGATASGGWVARRRVPGGVGGGGAVGRGGLASRGLVGLGWARLG